VLEVLCWKCFDAQAWREALGREEGMKLFVAHVLALKLVHDLKFGNLFP
jgi:hypothetical protein